MRSAPKGLFIDFFIVDIAFIMYWAITYLHLLPPLFLYKDYTNSISQAPPSCLQVIFFIVYFL